MPYQVVSLSSTLESHYPIASGKNCISPQLGTMILRGNGPQVSCQIINHGVDSGNQLFSYFKLASEVIHSLVRWPDIVRRKDWETSFMVTFLYFLLFTLQLKECPCLLLLNPRLNFKGKSRFREMAEQWTVITVKLQW